MDVKKLLANFPDVLIQSRRWLDNGPIAFWLGRIFAQGKQKRRFLDFGTVLFFPKIMFR